MLATDDDEDDQAVYEEDEFESVAEQPERAANMHNNTFYAGQNAKFFDKRNLASQKQNRPKNTFGNQPENE